MVRAAWLGWLWIAVVALGAERAQAQPQLQVTRTFGDGSEATCLVVEGDDLWVGSLGDGVTLWSPTGDQRFDSVLGLAGNRVRDCVLAHGVVWVASDAGLSRYNAEQRRFVIRERGPFLRLAGDAHTLVAARADGLVLRFERDGTRSELATHVAPSALALAPDGSGFALGSVAGAVYLGTGAKLRKLPLPERAGAAARAPIERLAFVGQQLRVSTAAGDWLVDPAAGTAVATKPEAAIADRALRGALVYARAHWRKSEVVASDAGAFMRPEVGAHPLQPLAARAGGLAQCGARISALAVVSAELWIGSFDRGLCRLEQNGELTRFAGPKYLPSDMVNALASAGPLLYVATDAGLTIVDTRAAGAPAFSQHTHVQCVDRLDGRCPWHAAVNGVAVDADGGAWVADIGALHRIDPTSGDWLHLGTRAVLGSQSVTRVAVHRGEVAVGTSNRGLLLRAAKAKRTRAIDDQAGLADNWITDLAYDASGRLWLATCTRGVSVRAPNGRFRRLGASDGLADDYVLSVQELAGRIWVGTLRGVSVIDGEQITSLSTADGLSGDEVHDAVLYDGAVWLATDGGLSVVRVEEQTQITGRREGGKKISITSSRFPSPRLPVVSSSIYSSAAR